MKYDIVLAGVGGHGVVSLGVVLAAGARKAGLQALLSEVHGMAQRGGSVEATLRLSDRPIHGALVPKGSADMVLSTELIEGLRHLDALSPEGVLVTGGDPHHNIPEYPNPDQVLEKIKSLPRALVIEAQSLAKDAGTVKATNLVMAGAASIFLPFAPGVIEDHVREVFARKGERIVEANIRAFRAGREQAQCSPLGQLGRTA